MMYWLTYILTWPWIRLFYPCKIKNKKNIVKGGGILICNHLSSLDVIYVGSYIHRRLNFLGKKELFDKKIKNWFFKSIGVIPIDRNNIDLKSIKTCLSVLKKGRLLVVFPEGTRNKGGEDLQTLKNGSAMFSIKSKLPIVPMHIEKRGKIFHKNTLTIGKPFELTEFYNKKLDSETLAEAGKFIQTELEKLF
ncbi:MAG: lysophospholipid acyltransferase family protein [Clostridia bacterium]|nr:lysophospholipid acyltransferase family protein [Clostridia bacterium]